MPFRIGAFIPVCLNEGDNNNGEVMRSGAKSCQERQNREAFKMPEDVRRIVVNLNGALKVIVTPSAAAESNHPNTRVQARLHVVRHITE